MNPDTDQLYGRIRNRVLTLSGNNPSIGVANGLLVIRDGPTAWVGPGEAPPVEQRMTTLRIARGERTFNHVIALRPTGFYTGNALQWMHDVGIAFTQLTFDGEIVFSTGPRRRWDALNTPGEAVWVGRSRRPSPSHDRLRRIYKETIAPKVAALTMSPNALAQELGIPPPRAVLQSEG
jgi:hypothetical protein